MGDVIKGRFGEKSKTIEKKNSPVDTADDSSEGIAFGEAYERALNAADDGDERAKDILVLARKELYDRVKEIKTFIENLGSAAPSTEVLAEAEKYWISLPTRELVTSIIMSNKTEWTKAPGRFLALVAEYRNRISRIIDVYSK